MRKPIRQRAAAAVSDERTVLRLARYGLSPRKALAANLTIASGQVLRLDAVSRGTPPRGHVRLRPRSIADLKRWIGVPDGVVPAPAGASLGGVVAARADRGDAALADLRDRYLVDGRGLDCFEHALDAACRRESVHGIFLDGDLELLPGSTLVVGRGVRILWARRVRVWRGSVIHLEGDVTLDCVSFEGQLESPPPEAPSGRPPLGTLLRAKGAVA